MQHRRRLFWAAVWLAAVLIAIKGYYLGGPVALSARAVWDFVRDLVAVSFVDVLFAALLWAAATMAMTLAKRRPLVENAVIGVLVGIAALSCLYAIASVFFFSIFGGFLTYPLLALVGDVHMLRSSVEAQVSRGTVLALAGVPLGYLILVASTLRFVPEHRGASWRPRAAVAAVLLIWVVGGQIWYGIEWTTRRDRQVAANAQWVFMSSWWQAIAGDGAVRMGGAFNAGDLSDFEPVRKALTAAVPRLSAARRPPNVVLIVLESVAARWASLNHGAYDSTPMLRAESGRGLVFDNFYAHIGRSSNSLGAILLSTFPKLDFSDLTEEYPRLPGTSIASVFHDRGYRTAFITPSDLDWADWRSFLDRRGFDLIADHRQLPCETLLSSWGMEDRCAVDGAIDFIEQDPSHPFFVMAWTQQTHHPYEPTPGVPLIEFVRDPVPDAYDLNRYLNVLHETDRHLARLFETIRRAGLEQDTLIVVTGDHGQAFGDPHDSYMQGRTVYEEDVNVPLLLWYPRLPKRRAARPSSAATSIWRRPSPRSPAFRRRRTGRVVACSIPLHPPRAYFYVAEDHYSLGVREGTWKYIFDLREGAEELYDLSADPTEQHNLAAAQPERCARLRQRLAAWTDANRRQYDKVATPQTASR